MLWGVCLIAILGATALYAPSEDRDVLIPLIAALGVALLVILWAIQRGGPWLGLVAPIAVILDLGAYR